MAATGAPAPFEGANRRKWSRYETGTEIPATLVLDDERVSCRIENISLAGAKLRVRRDAPRGTFVRLACETGGDVRGRCIWSGSQSMGICFGLSEPSIKLAFSCIKRVPAIAEALARYEAAEGVGTPLHNS